MKELFKKFVVVIVAITLLFFSGILIIEIVKLEPTPIKPNAAAIVDSVNNVRYAEMNAAVEMAIKQSELDLQKAKSGTLKAKQQAATYKELADSAEARYKRSKSIERCDSTIAAKNVEISGLIAENDSLDAEAQCYSDLLLVQKQKVSNLEAEIVDKNKTIEFLKIPQPQPKRKSLFWVGFGSGLIVGLFVP